MLPEVAEVWDAEVAVACGDGKRVSLLRMLELMCLLEDAAMPQSATEAAAVADRLLDGD